MNNILKNIFLFIAEKMGLELSEKTIQDNDFFDVDNLSITGTFAERLATITLMGSDMKVDGTSARAELIQTCMSNLFQDHLKDAVTFALGTGSCLIRPYTDGTRFGFDIIPEQNYAITGYIGDYIYSVLIQVGTYKDKNNHTYSLIESEKINKDADGTNYVEINYNAFCDNKPCDLSETKWNDYESHRIANVDKLLIGRIKCPITNRKDVNSPNGVGITFGQQEQVNNAKDSYRQYNQEREDKETMIFADKTLLKKDENGSISIPKGKDRLFMRVRGGNVDSSLIDTYSPEIRDNSLDNEIERNFRVLELACGLGEGILSRSTLTYTNMDEVRASKSATYAFMSALRNRIDGCIDSLLYAIDMIANYNNVTPQGDYEAHIEWSDEYMNSIGERFNQLMAAESVGWIEPAEGRATIMNEDIDEAREAIEKIKADKMAQMEQMMGGADDEGA